MIQRPGYYNPYRHPDRVRDRRNLVLALMRQNDDIDDREYALAVESPLNLAKGASQSIDAPYFVDMVNEILQNQFQDVDFQANSFRVYTTLDLDLQRAATEAVRDGMERVDELIRKQKRFKGQTRSRSAVRADRARSAHGRDQGAVGRTQLRRQPVEPYPRQAPAGVHLQAFRLRRRPEYGRRRRTPRILTPGTTVVDEPTTFWYDDKPYEPSNFKHEFHGTVTLPPGAGEIHERGHRQGGRDGGLRHGGGPGRKGRFELRYSTPRPPWRWAPMTSRPWRWPAPTPSSPTRA